MADAPTESQALRRMPLTNRVAVCESSSKDTFVGDRRTRQV